MPEPEGDHSRGEGGAADLQRRLNVRGELLNRVTWAPLHEEAPTLRPWV
jgi:hypothetical protein